MLEGSPPEVISGLMYAGAGAGPLMAAAAAYANLAAEVSTTATQWESIMSTLTTGSWTGGGSVAAATASEPIVAYLTQTAAAYEAAFAATVPPAEIAANRALLAQLVATNFLGINTPAIAATEAQYAAMWAQDSAMYAAYQAASTASSALTPVTPLVSTANPASASAVDNAALAADATGGTAQAAAAPLAQAASLPFTTNGILGSIDNFLGTPAVLNGINGAVNTAAWFVMNTIPTAVSLSHTLGGVPAVAVSDVMPAGAGGITEGLMVGSVAPMGGMGAGMGALGAATSASVGEAGAVGGLSVPASWSTAAPATLASSTAPLEGSGWTVAAETAEGAPVTAMPGMPGMAAAAKGAGAYGAGPRYGVKPIVMPKQVVV